MGTKGIQGMDKFRKKARAQIESRGRLYRPVETGQSRRVGELEINDADFWRGKYDELLQHLEHQNKYLRFLEGEVFGGSPF